MKERPILFTPEHAQKVLVGTKTQTRRIVKRNASGRVQAVGSPKNWHLDDPDAVLACPYGAVGDRLWIKEAWAWPGEELFMHKGCPADAETVEKWKQDKNAPPVKWKPSLYMPRWACRTVVELTEVRVERVWEISERDAIAEGVQPCGHTSFHVDEHTCSFRLLWETIHGKGSWALNPWVWALTFKKVLA